MQAATELRCGRVWSRLRFDFLKRWACLGTVHVLFQLGGRGVEAQLLIMRNCIGICWPVPKLHAKFMVAVWGIKICALKAPVQWRWSYTILYFAPKDNSPFFIVLPFFTYFHTAPPNLGVFDRFFAIRNEYHIIGDECGSSMVCMQPWFTCSFGLHALCSLLYWVQFVKTQGKVQNFIKTACRAADCMGIYSPIPALYGSVLWGAQIRVPCHSPVAQGIGQGLPGESLLTCWSPGDCN